MSNLIGVKEAAKLLGVSTKTIRRWELEIITVFSARLYGSRSHKNKALVKQLPEVLKDDAKLVPWHTATHMADKIE